MSLVDGGSTEESLKAGLVLVVLMLLPLRDA
jgi:hypothetical protein